MTFRSRRIEDASVAVTFMLRRIEDVHHVIETMSMAGGAFRRDLKVTATNHGYEITESTISRYLLLKDWNS